MLELWAESGFVACLVSEPWAKMRCVADLRTLEICERDQDVLGASTRTSYLGLQTIKYRILDRDITIITKLWVHHSISRLPFFLDLWLYCNSGNNTKKFKLKRNQTVKLNLSSSSSVFDTCSLWCNLLDVNRWAWSWTSRTFIGLPIVNEYC